MGLAWRFLVCVLLTVSGGLPLHALAASVILIASDESGAFNEAAEAIATELRSAGHHPQTLQIPLRAEDVAAIHSTPLIVTLGTRAAQTVSSLAPRTLVLHTLLPRSAFEKLPGRGDDTRRAPRPRRVPGPVRRAADRRSAAVAATRWPASRASSARPRWRRRHDRGCPCRRDRK